MIIVRVLIVAFIGCLIFAGCEQSGNQRVSKVSNYSYVVYKDLGSDKPSIGDQVFFQMDIRDNKDSLLQDVSSQ